jgi:predicted ester cyclase
MTREEVSALLVRRREAFLRRDWTAFGAIYSETAKLDSPLAGAVSGRDAIVRASEAFFGAFPDAVITEDTPAIDGDRASIVAEVVGTHVGEILGLAPTGRAFRIPMAFIIELRDRQIIYERRIYDFTGLLVQIGVLKAKPA